MTHLNHIRTLPFSSCGSSSRVVRATVLFCCTISSLALVVPLHAQEAGNDLPWEILFDGKSAEHFRNYKQDSLSPKWQIVDGALTLTAKGGGDIITKETYDAFELSLEYRISRGGNSGIMFHVVQGSGPPWATGPEIQVLDNIDGKDPQKSGWLYQLYKPKSDPQDPDRALDATNPPGQWNHLRVKIHPEQSEVALNGVVYYTFVKGSEDWNQRVAESKFSKMEGFGRADRGHICLQDHGDEVAFRDIKIRRLLK